MLQLVSIMEALVLIPTFQPIRFNQTIIIAIFSKFVRQANKPYILKCFPSITEVAILQYRIRFTDAGAIQLKSNTSWIKSQETTKPHTHSKTPAP
jgi:hypothetical protein